MRKSIIFLCLMIGVLWISSPLSIEAETIYLKNGRTIWADHVRVNGSHIEYDVGDNTYAIPKSSVDHIEAGGFAPLPSSSASNHSAQEVPVFSPSTEPAILGGGGLAAKIIQNGAVSSDGLAELQQAGDAKLTAAGYYIAGKYEFEHSNFPQSKDYFGKALRFDPENPAILNYYAALLVRTGNASDALGYAQRAVRIAPNSPDALAVLGYAQFASEHNREAIVSWKHSLELRPDTQLAALLFKAQREVANESDFSERESGHFTLHYEGKQSSENLRSQLLSTLESDYADLANELGIAPRASIPVILYTEQAFFDVTQAPAWSGAVNDGKLRIPIQGLSSMTSDLAHVLKHELTHSFVNQLSAGRCPQWLNEGVAQAMEPKALSSGHRLAELFHAQQEIPYNALEGGFMRFSSAEAVLAYEESLAAVLYISDTYGMSDVQRILQRIGQGSSTEAALRTTIHTDYAHLDQEVGQYLASKY